jgi:hypothetical protein
VIRGFRHKGLEELFRKGRGGKVAAEIQRRALRRVDALEHAAALRDLNIPGFDFHPLRGKACTSTARGVSRLNGVTATRGMLTSNSTIEEET